MTIYLDLIWVLNYLIDYLLLLLTALVLKRRHTKVRFGLAALFASMIVFLMFTPVASWFYHPVTKLIYSAFIILIAFGYKRWTYYVQGLAMFYFVTFMTGGALFALHFFWQTELDLFSSGLRTETSIGSPVSWLLVVLGFPLVWYFSKHRFDTIETKAVNFQQLAKVEISIGEHCFKMDGLIDSGNQLRDPITRVPVMIIEANLLEEAFGQDVVKAMLHLNMDDSSSNTQWLSDRLRIIPFRAVGQSQPFLAAIKPDEVKVRFQDQVYRSTHVLVGVQQMEFSPDGLYKAILHPKQVLGIPEEQLA
ncbi:sigma-E processing peptidase SpoIIGA [Alkalicoccobacillus murimartini]|uniref:Sporulation sigma-E factor-processing peptidase n=1 Tax=Alkalicoccobacillus murimartini TaxID=171685 RepID=A0ABT9YFE7_9BACI|nr:sigma-E processing peptidase SpoIIGA [Alkalicoccobacillus murimartini]MDQ0206439.1 stage II sporulation protein GA (sporulation sigma-E factor processing peptidase) [Alkalicoccobacillus murimartini]